MKKLAVTGGLSCGKSTVCHFFEEFGAYVVSADHIVHRLLTPISALGQQVIALLGPEIIRGDEIDRQQVAWRVFEDSQRLQQLEELIHPAVKREIDRLYNEQTNYPLFVVEIPLLFEAGMEGDYDATLAVVCSEELARHRSAATSYDQRMARQLPLSQKAARADYVIHNEGTLKELRDQCHTLFDQLV